MLRATELSKEPNIGLISGPGPKPRVGCLTKCTTQVPPNSYILDNSTKYGRLKKKKKLLKKTEYSHDLETGKDFLNRTLQVITIKRRVN